MEDCDLLENKIKILLNEMTYKTECISTVDLAIDGEYSPKWRKHDHPNIVPDWLMMENPGNNRRRKGQRWVTVTARNPNSALRDKKMSFHVNVENCAYFGANNGNEETTKEPGDQDDSQNDQENTATNKADVEIPIIAGAVCAIILLVLAVVVLLVCRKKKRIRNESETNKTETDENHTYGTYSRG